MSQVHRVLVRAGALAAILCAPACGENGTKPPDPPDPPAAGDRGALIKLYEATDGPSWINNDGWNTDEPLEEWYGVGTDRSGRVVELDLGGTWDDESQHWTPHGLSGSLPPEIGDLARLRLLVLAGNELRGSIPWEIGQLTELTRLDLGGNRLTDRIPPPIGNLAGLKELDLRDNLLFGPIPSQIGELEALERLFLQGNALTGAIPPEIGNLSSLTELFLSEHQLTYEMPVHLGRLTNLKTLSLWQNQLTKITREVYRLTNLTTLLLHDNYLGGAIPWEIGEVAALERLTLHGNALSGEIPPELGNLAGLVELSLHSNRLTGGIPPELGNLGHLVELSLHGNRLTGGIPPELSNLARARVVSLGHNELSGPIPAELGRLPGARVLALAHNALTGPVPPELASLPQIERLYLDHNDLTGPVPAAFGAMTTLRELGLTNNPSMAGPLPADLVSLGRLEVLMANGTGLCVPGNDAVLAWLERVHKRRISACGSGEPPRAYLIQTVQSREWPVPLVAGEGALLRVFVTAPRPTTATIPLVRARFYHDGVEAHVEEIPGKPTEIPTEVVEHLLSATANAEIPAEIIRPGLEVVIEIDPDGELDPELGVATRIPESGRLAVEVHAPPTLDLTLIPFLWTPNPNGSVVRLVSEIAADPDDHQLLRRTHTLMPVAEIDVRAHPAVESTSNHSLPLLRQTTAIRAMEGGTGHYMGMMAPPVFGPAGLAHLPGRSSFSAPSSILIPHLLGHNFSLGDAPCGDVPRPDPYFPDSLGAIGTWAYDGSRLVAPTRLDVMSGCTPVWISPYHFTNALRFRMSDADSVGLPMLAPSAEALLLWGGIDARGNPFLEPAFVVDAPPSLPGPGGEFRLAGRTGDGAVLFSFRFDMPEVAHADGSSGFAFALPVGDGWAGTLSAVTLAGPGGSATLDADSDLPMAILRDPRTGHVRAFLRDLPATVLTRADAVAVVGPGPGLEVLFSRGVPADEDWRRHGRQAR